MKKYLLLLFVLAFLVLLLSVEPPANTYAINVKKIPYEHTDGVDLSNRVRYKLYELEDSILQKCERLLNDKKQK